MNLFKRWLKITPVTRDVCRLTLGEWRADRNFVATGARLLADPNFRIAMDCVANSSPAFDVLPIGTQPHDRMVQQARIEGYMLCLNNIMALGIEQALSERLEATFEDEGIPTKK